MPGILIDGRAGMGGGIRLTTFLTAFLVVFLATFLADFLTGFLAIRFISLFRVLNENLNFCFFADLCGFEFLLVLF